MPRKQPTKHLSAERFTLLDSKGAVKADLFVAADGLPCFNLYPAAKAAPSLTVSIDSDGHPKVNFHNRAGHCVIAIGTDDHLGQGITLADSAGRPVCFIAVRPSGIPEIQLIQMTSPTTGKKLWASPKPKPRKK